jgi:hypothetical protein
LRADYAFHKKDGATMGNPTTVDEAIPVMQYIIDEMNRNAHGQDARLIRDNNTFDAMTCIANWQGKPLWQQLLGFAGMDPQQCTDMTMSTQGAALLGWTLKVRQNGDWDHKKDIPKLFGARNGYWHILRGYEYYYDIWSNVHYGYVGAACAFSETVLLDGAGLEQIGSSLARLSTPQITPGVQGLRKFDDPSDRASISIGIKLYKAKPTNVTLSDLLPEILANKDLTKRVPAGKAAAAAPGGPR